MSKLQVFDIFWDNTNKMKNNLGQEHVKSGKIASDFLGQMTIFSGFDPTIPPVPPCNLAFPPTENYISEISNNRNIRWKSFIMLSFRLIIVDLVAT